MFSYNFFSISLIDHTIRIEDENSNKFYNSHNLTELQGYLHFFFHNAWRPLNPVALSQNHLNLLCQRLEFTWGYFIPVKRRVNYHPSSSFFNLFCEKDTPDLRKCVPSEEFKTPTST